MTIKDKNIANAILKKIKEINPNAEVILYGSRARGDYNPHSDWDILILLNDLKVNLENEQIFRHHIFDLELEIGEPISIMVRSKNDWEENYSVTPLYKSIKGEGITL
ncbi:MAG: nucleotidyltransferase domain-containing protein [Bacteroidales bacterium]|nr:nucleotidyltransferase domain-containing protein [Bacteroidales bacterium]